MLKRQYTDPEDDDEDTSEFENSKRSRIQENGSYILYSIIHKNTVFVLFIYLGNDKLT